MSLDSKREIKIGEALNLQQINLLQIESLKLDLEEGRSILPQRLKKVLDTLEAGTVKTANILDELSEVQLNDAELAPGEK